MCRKGGSIMPVEIDAETIRWAVGCGFTVVSAAMIGLWQHLTKRINSVEAASKKDVANIWNVMNAERDNASKFRMDITASVARLPTREELDRRFVELARDIKDTLKARGG